MVKTWGWITKQMSKFPSMHYGTGAGWLLTGRFLNCSSCSWEREREGKRGGLWRWACPPVHCVTLHFGCRPIRHALQCAGLPSEKHAAQQIFSGSARDRHVWELEQPWALTGQECCLLPELSMIYGGIEEHCKYSFYGFNLEKLALASRELSTNIHKLKPAWMGWLHDQALEESTQSAQQIVTGSTINKRFIQRP